MSDRDKRKQLEQQERTFNELMRDDANNYCADCGARSAKWCSWNVGVFLCMRCAGVHRKLGTHITKVKSMSLDVWTPEQIESIRAKGNARANALFNPNGIAPPRNPSDRDIENYIRDKYERKAFMSAAGRAASSSSTSGGYGSAAAAASSSVSARPASANPWTSELRQLHDMGFTYDPYNLKALDQAKGNVQGAVELIIGMGDPPAGAAAGSTPFTAPVRPAMDSRTVMRGAKVTISADAPAVRQLRNMGFTDLPVVMAALQKSDGDLDAAIVYMTDRADELRAYMAANPAAVAAAAFDQNAYAQQFMAQESQHQQYRAPSPAAPAAAAQPQQHQFSAPAAAPVAAAKPKSDLLDLFGELGGSDPFGAQQQPAMQPAGGLAFGGGMMMGGGGGFGAPVAAPAMGGYGGAQPPQFGMPQPQQQQMQLQSSPFGGPAGYGVPATAAAPASSSNPFGDFVSAPATAAPAQQQQPVRTGPAADIMALYGQQQQQQQQMAQRGMMPGGPFGGAGAPGMMMMGGGSGGFGGPTPNPFGAQMGGMGPGMPAQMGGAQMGGAQMGGMQMGGGGGGGVPNYSMASSPFGGGAAAQPRQPLPSGYIPGPGSAMSTSSPFGGAGSTFSSSSAAPAGAAADPFAGFGNVSAFSMGSTTSSAPSKAPSGSSTNPFM